MQTAVSETNGKGGMPSGGSADFYSIRLSGCLDNNEDKGKLYTPASTASKPGYFEVSRCPAASLPQQCARFECGRCGAQFAVDEKDLMIEWLHALKVCGAALSTKKLDGTKF